MSAILTEEVFFQYPREGGILLPPHSFKFLEVVSLPFMETVHKKGVSFYITVYPARYVNTHTHSHTHTHKYSSRMTACGLVASRMQSSCQSYAIYILAHVQSTYSLHVHQLAALHMIDLDA